MPTEQEVLSCVLVFSSEVAPALCWPQVRGGPPTVPVFLYVVHKNFHFWNRFKWYKKKFKIIFISLFIFLW